LSDGRINTPRKLVPAARRVYDQEKVDAWTFIWLMVILKIPIVGLYLIVRWAVRQTPEATGEDGGIGPLPGALHPRDPSHPHHPAHPRHPRPRLPRSPRRGPHGDAPFAPPARVRAVVARSRLVQS
jgi:hypothetical protein